MLARGQPSQDWAQGLGRTWPTETCRLCGRTTLNQRTNDITQRKRGMVNNGLVLQVNNNNLGGDPAPGADKVLTVIYRVRGREQTATVKRGTRCEYRRVARDAGCRNRELIGRVARICRCSWWRISCRRRQ